MRAAILDVRTAQSTGLGVAFADGLARHGIRAEPYRQGPTPHADFVAVWGWREAPRLRARGWNVLVLERGYLGDRMAWTSLGWNGLNGKATWHEPPAGDGLGRFNRHFGHLVQPWRIRGDGHALIIGQVPGDASIKGVNMGAWYARACDAMRARGLAPRFRPHPQAVRRNNRQGEPTAPSIGGSLAQALAGAAVAVTYNSNAGVDAALAGVPVIACDEGAMAWPVAAHGLDHTLITPDRDDWLGRMAWRQWTFDEIASGLAWEHVRTGLYAPAASVDASEPLVDAPKGRRALVLGGAACLWDDVEAALSLGEFDGVVACNDAGAYWRGKLDAWCTLHPNKLGRWTKERAARGYPPASRLFSHRVEEPHDITVSSYHWKPGGGSSGSSGLYSTKIALELGFERLVLCGIPMTPEPHFFNRAPWAAYRNFSASWRTLAPRLLPNVKSMSGWTRTLLGSPSESWLRA